MALRDLLGMTADVASIFVVVLALLGFFWTLWKGLNPKTTSMVTLCFSLIVVMGLAVLLERTSSTVREVTTQNDTMRDILAELGATRSQVSGVDRMLLTVINDITRPPTAILNDVLDEPITRGLNGPVYGTAARLAVPGLPMGRAYFINLADGQLTRALDSGQYTITCPQAVLTKAEVAFHRCELLEGGQ